MLTHLAAAFGLALLCGAWVLIQRWVTRRDPEAPTVESYGCGSGCSRR